MRTSVRMCSRYLSRRRVIQTETISSAFFLLYTNLVGYADSAYLFYLKYLSISFRDAEVVIPYGLMHIFSLKYIQNYDNQHIPSLTEGGGIFARKWRREFTFYQFTPSVSLRSTAFSPSGSVGASLISFERCPPDTRTLKEGALFFLHLPRSAFPTKPNYIITVDLFCVLL